MNIMFVADGSRRWAKENGLSIKEGYDAAIPKLTMCFEYLCSLATVVYVPVCTMNNLTKRPQEELPWFLNCFYEAALHVSSDISFKIEGNLAPLENFPEHRKKFLELENKTGKNTEKTIVFLIGWSSDDEVVDLFNNLAPNGSGNYTKEYLIANSAIKQPIDLIIRTGRAKRLSAMMPVFSPYAEIEFINKLFPDVLKQDIKEIIEAFSNTERRFGV